MNSFWSVARKYPPILCRLLARHKGGPPLTTAEIVCRCAEEGWPMSSYMVGVISSALDWEEIPHGQMRVFLAACRIDFCDRKSMNRVSVYLKTKHKFTYLIRSPEWETVLRPLVSKWREHIEKKLK